MTLFHLTASVTVTRLRDGTREVFWARRTLERKFIGGFYAFFAGAVEVGDEGFASEIGDENLRKFYGCARRELMEEGGLVVDAGRLLHLGRWRTPDWLTPPFETHFFRVDLEPGEGDELVDSLCLEEFIEGEWVEPGEALRRWEQGEAYLTTPLEWVLRGIVQNDPHPLPLEGPSTQGHIEVVGGLRVLPLRTATLPPATHTNCFIVGRSRFVVIDPGSGHARELDKLFVLVDGLIAAGGTFEAVLLTHEHPDHIGGVKAVIERYGVGLWCHEATTERLPLELYVDRELVDEEVIDLGDGQLLGCMHTPGHARGHLGFEHFPSRIVLVGDLVASTGTIVIDPPEGHLGDYLKSLGRVMELEAPALLPSHGWVISMPDKHLCSYIAHRWEREDQVEAALRQVARRATAMDLVPLVYADVPVAIWPLASRSLHAHLEHLVERGVAIRAGSDYLIE
jgi:glyoxylase-like metal-dependent hydrolase (beta-lactamase superfamily II)/8-oxo-dGTP pyrophosphatase MutT (NUDIX family)